MAPICATKSDRKSYMNEIDGFSVLLTFPKPKANRSRKRRQFDDFSLLQGVASLRPIHSYKTACTTTRICSMCFAREENAITRKWQNQKHCPSIRRNMQALPPREEWPCCNGATKTDWKNLAAKWNIFLSFGLKVPFGFPCFAHVCLESWLGLVFFSTAYVTLVVALLFGGLVLLLAFLQGFTPHILVVTSQRPGRFA